MEQQQKQKEQQQPIEQTTTTPSLISEKPELVSNDTSKSAIAENFDELSVDELNTLSPEQRRRHMLQAFEKKNAI